MLSVPAEVPQQNICTEEEVLADQQFGNHETSSSLDQEDPEPPQIKEEQEELCTSQEGEQLVVKLETDTFMLIPPDEESDHHRLSDNSHVAESQEGKEGEHEDSGLTRDAESEQMERFPNSGSNSNDVYNPSWADIRNSHAVKKSFICDTCGKAFNCKSKLSVHMRTHTGEKPYSCDTCGRRFSRTSDLNIHIRTHTGEKPYTCKICGKGFKQSSALWVHIRTHTGEKPYLCKICGKDFSRNDCLTIHMRRAHTGEKPYICNFCGKGFVIRSDLSSHIKLHTGKWP